MLGAVQLPAASSVNSSKSPSGRRRRSWFLRSVRSRAGAVGGRVVLRTSFRYRQAATDAAKKRRVAKLEPDRARARYESMSISYGLHLAPGPGHNRVCALGCQLGRIRFGVGSKTGLGARGRRCSRRRDRRRQPLSWILLRRVIPDTSRITDPVTTVRRPVRLSVMRVGMLHCAPFRRGNGPVRGTAERRAVVCTEVPRLSVNVC